MDIRRRALALVGVVTLLFALGACSAGATPSTQQDAEAATCAALQTWSDEMRALAALDPATASAQDVQAQADKVTSAWDAVKTAMANVNSADKAAVEAGWATLQSALKNIPTDVPISQAIAGVQTAADGLKAAYRQMGDGLGCTFVTPY